MHIYFSVINEIKLDHKSPINKRARGIPSVNIRLSRLFLMQGDKSLFIFAFQQTATNEHQTETRFNRAHAGGVFLLSDFSVARQK
jgi:hypothetical protein